MFLECLNSKRFIILAFENSIYELIIDDDVQLKFERIRLKFNGEIHTDVFGVKNNKTLKETLESKKYSKFWSVVSSRYKSHLDVPLGEFLLHLKQKGDSFYQEFLNKSGDLAYSKFEMSSDKISSEMGVYAFLLVDELKYVGRCMDTMKKRINQGYGKIHPKNCYIDGQVTNCRVNALITESGQNISLWFHIMSSKDKIKSTELQLIQRYNPPWNSQ